MNHTNASAPPRSGLVLPMAFVAALIVNLTLLLLIGALISQREAELVSEATPQPIEFIRIIPKTPEQKPVSTLAQTEIIDHAPERKPKEKSAAVNPVKPPKAASQPPSKRTVSPKPIKTKPVSPKIPAPRIDIPQQGAGPEFAAVPGTDARLAAPPPKWDAQKTETAKTAQGDGTETENGGGSGILPLVVLSRVAPNYPNRARDRGIEGWVKLEIVVTPQGKVGEARVVDANPKHIFDQAALIAIRRWRFKPTYKDGQAIEQRAVQTISFRFERQR